MKTPAARYLMGVAFVALALTMLPEAAAAVETNCFVCLDSTRLNRLVKGVGLPGHLAGISRNGVGTELQLTIRTNEGYYGSPWLVLAILSERGTELKAIPRDTAATDLAGRPLCHYSGPGTHRSFVFAGGATLPHEEGAFVSFSPDRTVFFISASASTRQARVYRTADPLGPSVRLPDCFAPQGIFVCTNKIFVFGQRPGQDPRPGYPSECWGLMLSGDWPRVTVKRDIDLSRFGAVLDMDVGTGLLLVDGKRDMLRPWGLYDPTTGRYKPLGIMRGRGFFLRDGFARYLEGLWRK